MTSASVKGARVLLTGCTGFVGKVVLEELLRRREELAVERVYLLVRPRRNRSAADRFDQEVATSPCFARSVPGWRDLCHPVAGDITEAGLGIAEDDAARLSRDVTHVIHCAASVKFDLPIADAARINIAGALEVLEFARRCSGLERLVDVSTAYVTPHPGNGVPVEETLVDLPFEPEELYDEILAGGADEKALLARSGHANTYTLTKCLAEILLARHRGDTPLTLLRPSVVSACRRYPYPGWIDSRAAYAAFVALLGAGYLRAVRIDPNTAPDLVPCDDVADRILSCAFDPSLQQPLVIRHAVAGLANSGRLAELTRKHEQYFRAHPHEREARWTYHGPSGARFRLHDLLHHRLPLGAARVAARLRGRKADAARIRKLASSLGQLDRPFHYFAHHTFDFRTAFPPLEDFDLDAYVETISAGVSEHLLKRDPRQAPLRMHGTDLGWALRQPHGNATVRSLGYVIRKTLRAARTEITFDEVELKAALRQVGPEDLVVLAPSHRSYFDFLITSLLCFAHPGLGLKIPRVAATDDFARIPIVGSLLEAAGAFYIKRGLGVPDPELTSKITDLVRQGQSLEFYPEGTRSRSRRFLAPKRGILRALQQTGRPVVVLPLSISYDRVAEEVGFLSELDGRGRARSGLGPMARWTMRLLRGEINLGRVHIRCGTPLRLDSESDPRELSLAIVAELQRHAVVSTFHLDTFCRHNASSRIDPDALRAAIARRGGVVVDSRLDRASEVPAALARTFECQWMHLFYADALARLPGDAAVESHVRRNGFWYPEAPADEPVAPAVVEALFTPIRRDHERVREAAEALPAGLEFNAEMMVQKLPGAFLRDVEDALAHLAEEGVLSGEGQTFRRVGGPAAGPARGREERGHEERERWLDVGT
jgi:alcohol-forming fatty acyl-CoA reductase